MFYFFHATSIKSFKNILKSKYIQASIHLDTKYLKTTYPLKYVFTNIYEDGLPLEPDEKQGLGEITIIIDPIILKYKLCYFNLGWQGDIDNSIIMNYHVDEVLDLVKANYKYPFILTHETLFRNRISTKFIIGINM